MLWLADDLPPGIVRFCSGSRTRAPGTHSTRLGIQLNNEIISISLLARLHTSNRGPDKKQLFIEPAERNK
jgi:hypothetical protein